MPGFSWFTVLVCAACAMGLSLHLYVYTRKLTFLADYTFRSWRSPSKVFSGLSIEHPQPNMDVHLVITTCLHHKPGHHGEDWRYIVQDAINAGWLLRIYAKTGGSCDCNVSLGQLQGQCAKMQNELRPLDTIRVIPNVGDECSGYLLYVLDHYDRLPEMVVFMQGFPYDTLPFPFPTISSLSWCADFTRPFTYLTYFATDTRHWVFNETRFCTQEYVSNLSTANSILLALGMQLHNGAFTLPNGKNIKHFGKAGAQFAVRRNRILSSPLVLYQQLYDNVMGVNDVQYRCRHWACEGRVCKQCIQMEYLWALVFGSGLNESERGIFVNTSRPDCDPHFQENLTDLIPSWLREKFVPHRFHAIRNETVQRTHVVREKSPNRDHEGHTVLAQLYILCAGQPTCTGFVYTQSARPWVLQRIPKETSAEGYLFSCERASGNGCRDLVPSLEHWTFIKRSGPP